MKAEQIILSFIAVLIGLLTTGIIFFVYQTTKTIPPNNQASIRRVSPAPTSTSSIFLTIDSPKDEEVVDRKIVTVSGKTIKDATVVISTNTEDVVVEPSLVGAFSTTATLLNDYNRLEIVAIAPNGEEARVVRSVTFSTETF